MTNQAALDIIAAATRQARTEKRSAAAKGANRKPRWTVHVAALDSTDRPDLARNFSRRTDADKYAAVYGALAFVTPFDGTVR